MVISNSRYRKFPPQIVEGREDTSDIGVDSFQLVPQGGDVTAVVRERGTRLNTWTGRRMEPLILVAVAIPASAMGFDLSSRLGEIKRSHGRLQDLGDGEPRNKIAGMRLPVL